MVATKRAVTRIALSPTTLVAIDDRLPSGSAGDLHQWMMTLAAPLGDGQSWPALGEALRELAAHIGASRSAASQRGAQGRTADSNSTSHNGQLHIALLAPLTEVRRLTLPPLRADEQVRLLSRTAGKYFLTVREPQIVGVAPAPKRQSGGVVCAAVAARLVAILHAEAAAAGWLVQQIVPAEAAWTTASSTMWPARARGEAHTIVAHDDRTDVLHTSDGKLIGVRRFRAGATDLDAMVESFGVHSGAPAHTLAVFGMDEQRRVIGKALSDRGMSVRVPTAEWASATTTPQVAAATFVAPDEPFRLRTDDAVALRTAREHGVAWRLGFAAAALLVVAAAVEWYGVRRELTTVRADRAAIAPQVRDLLAGQLTQAASARRIASIADSYVAAPQWSAAIATLSEALDDGAFLLLMRARGDTLTIDGLATRASQAFKSVEQIPAFSAVRAAGEMRVERQEDGTVLERFTIQARVARDSVRGAQ